MSEVAVVEGVAVDTRHWIGGQRVASPRTFTDVSPIDEQPLAEVATGGPAEVGQAVAAAEQAFPRWAAMPRDERADILHRVADGIDKRAEELALVETRDNGSLLRSHRRSVMPRVGMNFRYFADMLRDLSHPDREIRGHRERITWDPAGVTAVITPWNAPLMLATWRIGPALAAGNTVVAKPPEWAPLTASLLADITAEAGLPPGVFNVVQGLGPKAGAALSAHPGILHRVGPHGCTPPGPPPAPHRPAVLRARRQVPAARLRRRRLRPGGAPGRRAVRQRRPGLPGRVPHPGAGLDRG
jgi:aminomuconate-semialdehyde/2-hydroxymuconate-6-semialdehyde dehydrogenase